MAFSPNAPSRRWLLATACAIVAGLTIGTIGTAMANQNADGGRVIVLINPNSNEAATQSMTGLAQIAAADAAVVEDARIPARPRF
ncbi:hypothetical protein QWZ10_22295 [Paracoccus cavernae]|uniref:Uncharacterized protein n=1 Tax=Paracoccus cavernae TaxID=1571207 RepID=A0ABT8DBY4_9RHOB|nr:hypothetical protein [Paracoccus cavernae]MDN3713806.1 hypothetical protein [Paracoccus cavernae]